MSQTLQPSPGLGDPDAERIVLRGVVDEGAGIRLGAMLAERLADGLTVLDLDLSAVETIDEQGLVGIVRAFQEMAAGGHELRLLDPSPAVGPLLAMTGLAASYTDR